jgi:hypothetical protein
MPLASTVAVSPKLLTLLIIVQGQGDTRRLLLGKKKRGWVARCDTLLLLSSACPPRIVARTQGYTYAAKV